MMESRKQLVNNSPANHSAGLPPTKIGRFLSEVGRQKSADKIYQPIFLGREKSADF